MLLPKQWRCKWTIWHQNGFIDESFEVPTTTRKQLEGVLESFFKGTSLIFKSIYLDWKSGKTFYGKVIAYLFRMMSSPFYKPLGLVIDACQTRLGKATVS